MSADRTHREDGPCGPDQLPQSFCGQTDLSNSFLSFGMNSVMKALASLHTVTDITEAL